MSPLVLALAFATALAAVHPAVAAAQAVATGIVVDGVGPPWSGARRAGLQPGDVITHWALPGADAAGEHAITGLADWMEAESEYGVTVDGLRLTFVRGGAIQTTTLSGGAWMVTASPVLDPSLAPDHARALALEAKGDQAAAGDVWQALAERTATRDEALAAWFSLRAGGAALAARNTAAAEARYTAARDGAARTGQLWLERDALDGLARARQAGQRAAEAVAARQEAVELMRTRRPDSPTFVRTLNALAAHQRDFGRLEDAERTYREARDIARRTAAGTTVETAALGGLSTVVRRRGDLAAADALLVEAGAIIARFPSWHPDRLSNLGNRGILLFQMNRQTEAEQLLLEAERLDRERGTPAAQVALDHHGNLGVAAAQRGDLARAEVYFRSNLDAVAVAAPESLDRARATLNLATLIAERGDTARALAEFEAGVSLLARVAPNSTLHAGALINVGSARTRLGDVAGGTRAFEQARAMLEVSAPDSAELSGVLANLARNAQRRGDLDAASALAAQAVAHVSRVAPAGTEASFVHHVAGLVAAERGGAEDARRSQETVVRLGQTTAPGTRWAVPALTALAELDVRGGRLDQAALRYAEALEVLGTQVRRMGAALDVEAAFLDHANVQRPYVDVLLALGRQDAALEAIENVRARAVLDRLATRDLSFGRADEAGRLARERRSLATAYDQTLAQAARLPANAPEEQVRQVQTRLADLRERQALAASNLRRVDPALAEQLDPSPARADDLRRGLPAGTLALVYHLGAERPSVFAVSRDALRVAPLGEPAARLAARVGTWRRLMSRGRTMTDSDPELDDEARALYAALIAPVAAEVSRATRVVVVPDGVLHGLAFGALRRDGSSPPGAAARRDRAAGVQAYMAAWKPTTVAPSLSALAQLAARPRHAAGERTAVVVGDASFTGAPGGGTEGDRRVRSAVIEGLPPLPGSRREAEDVARTFRPRARLLLGDAATEPAVKGVARDTAILHIATHGVVNDLTPLDSALVLAAPAAAEDDNGLLQAWEIFDQVRIDADLVVLSACDTGLGRTFAGEGLLGLTRAFQFAGARAVVASLWKAPDAATAALMERFYREMAAGRLAAEALALAQRAVAAVAATAHPFHWAGFVVDGDGW